MTVVGRDVGAAVGVEEEALAPALHHAVDAEDVGVKLGVLLAVVLRPVIDDREGGAAVGRAMAVDVAPEDQVRVVDRGAERLVEAGHVGAIDPVRAGIARAIELPRAAYVQSHVEGRPPRFGAGEHRGARIDRDRPDRGEGHAEVGRALAGLSPHRVDVRAARSAHPDVGTLREREVADDGEADAAVVRATEVVLPEPALNAVDQEVHLPRIREVADGANHVGRRFGQTGRDEPARAAIGGGVDQSAARGDPHLGRARHRDEVLDAIADRVGTWRPAGAGDVAAPDSAVRRSDEDAAAALRVERRDVGPARQIRASHLVPEVAADAALRLALPREEGGAPVRALDLAPAHAVGRAVHLLDPGGATFLHPLLVLPFGEARLEPITGPRPLCGVDPWRAQDAGAEEQDQQVR